MSPYATPEDVRAVLVPDGGANPSTDPATAASMDDDVLDAVIARVSARVDARLGGRYQVPFDPVPPLIAALVADLAAFDATSTWRKDRDYESKLDPVYLRGQEAGQLLDALASGKATLDTGPASEPERSITVVNRYAGDMFTPRDFDLGYRHGRWEETRRGRPW